MRNMAETTGGMALDEKFPSVKETDTGPIPIEKGTGAT